MNNWHVVWVNLYRWNPTTKEFDHQTWWEIAYD